MRKLNLLMALLLSTNVFGQREATKTQTFSSEIEGILVSPKTGYVLVQQDLKISAYSNTDKSIVWEVGEEELGKKSTLKKVLEIDPSNIDGDEDDMTMVDGNDYVYSKVNDRTLVIDALTGKVVFNSAKSMGDAQIQKQIFLPTENSFGFVVLEKKQLFLKYFDLLQGKVVWEAPLGAEAGVKGAFSKNQMSRRDRMESFNDNLYALVNNNLFNIDKATGRVKWSLPEINQFYVCQNNKNLVTVKNKGGLMSAKKLFNLVEVTSGKQIWKDDVETKSLLKLEDWGDKILVAHYSGFNMFNYADGSKVWKKDVKGKDFKQVLSMGNDFLYVSEKDMILIDKDGKDKWKDDVEISDNAEDVVHYLGVSKSGKVMYITATYGNMVDYTSGKKIWKKNIKFNEERPLLYTYDEGKDIYLIYNDEELYKFDPNINDKPEPMAKIKAKSDKTMAGIELFDWGVSLTSQSEVIGIGNDGKVVFQKNYEQPGEEGRKALRALGTVGSIYMGTKASSQASTANTEVVMSYRDEAGQVHSTRQYLYNDKARANLQQKSAVNASAAATVDMLTQNVSKRFNALKQNSQFAYIFAKDKSGDTKSKVLVKVSKKDGKEVDKILVDNLKPLYEIDAATETLYYCKKDKLLIFE